LAWKVAGFQAVLHFPAGETLPDGTPGSLLIIGCVGRVAWMTGSGSVDWVAAQAISPFVGNFFTFLLRCTSPLSV